MFEAKALTGEKAGEIIYAKDPRLTHELCKIWKIYCPECTQFLYFSKSKNPDKRRSCFGHYDYEDKRCPERSLVTSQGHQSASLIESHEQDLETAELFIEQVFYGIDPEYFQNLKKQNNGEENQQIIDLIHWFKTSLLHDCKNWIKYYCETTGFLDWNNPEKEASYLMDWLHVLDRRSDILGNLALYFSSENLLSKKDKTLIQDKFSFYKEQKDKSSSRESLIWLIALESIVKQLECLIQDGLSDSKLILLPAGNFIRLKIPPNDKKLSLKKNRLYRLIGETIFFVVKRATAKQSGKYIDFNKSFPNRFCYSPNHESLLELRNVDNFRRKSFELYIDKEGDLLISGYLEEKRHLKPLIGGISDVLFDRLGKISMFALYNSGFISRDIAEKAAQLALSTEYGDLSPPEAFEKFWHLPGNLD